jgi:type IV pilus assembly protein PilQ
MPQKKYLFSLVFFALFLSSAHAEEQEVKPENAEVIVQDEAVSEPKSDVSESKPEENEEALAVQTKNTIRAITSQRSGNNVEIFIQCTKPPVHIISKLPHQTGFSVDIAAAEMTNPADLVLPKELNITLSAKTVQSDASGTAAARLEFVLPQVYAYSSTVQDNTVLVVIENFYPPAPSEQGAVTPPLLNIPSLGIVQQEKTNAITSHLPHVDPMKAMGGSSPAVGSGIPPAPGSLFDEYSDENLISIDFFKTDLHNVFRILGDTSEANLVIAEGVSGNLTLSLKDVPWDFALDIILNLKDLAMERRHNTIVIYPKSREFKWPKRATESSLSIDRSASSSIVIKQGDVSPQTEELTEGKKLVAQATRLEQSGNLEQAVTLYEKAFHGWPKNPEKAILANKIATVYLARLNQNAKAVYFAKQALDLDKKNTEAALTAAIGLANMGESSQAQQYFDQSVSIGKKPSQEALINYALFSERHQQYEAALRLLQKYDELYGESLDSMISRARILDQQGRRGEADQVYNALLHAGFQVPPDLRAFIMGRIRSSHVR